LEINHHRAVCDEIFEVGLEAYGIIPGDDIFGEFAGSGGEGEWGFGKRNGNKGRREQQAEQKKATNSDRHFLTINESGAGVNSGRKKSNGGELMRAEVVALQRRMR
jgi:hypothetical protein